MQKNVYAFGKMAGLSPNQTMEETIKLLTQYRSSLKSTNDFFREIVKDTTVAGVTTTKYLGILDEVNSHYDRMNRLMGATVEILRGMSSTGRNTAEDLKESMGGDHQSRRAAAPGAERLPQPLHPGQPDDAKRTVDARRSSYLDAVDKLSQATGVAPGELLEGLRKGNRKTTCPNWTTASSTGVTSRTSIGRRPSARSGWCGTP